MLFYTKSAKIVQIRWNANNYLEIPFALFTFVLLTKMKEHMKAIYLLGIAVWLCTANLQAQSEQVSTLTTTANRQMDLTPGTANFGTSASATESITLNSSVRYQTIDGFGAAITGSTAYNLSLMPADARHQFLKETFGPNNYGFGYVRISIGCSDFSLSEYTLCDEPGLEHFGLTIEETKYVIPALKEILEINPALKIMGSPWTCPKWMKVKSLEEPVPFDSWTSGQLNPAYYQDYAAYFVKWIEAMQAAGIPIYSITLQNEPLNKGNSASLFMTWQEQQRFAKEALGPALKRAALNVKVYAFDHNYNYDDMPDQQQYPLHIYEDAETARYFAGAAYHNYGGRPTELLRIQQEAPDKELIFTEASIGTWNKGRDLEVALLRDVRELGLNTANGWCRGAIVWNLMLDTDRGPHRGQGACATCYGAVDVDNTNYTDITRNSHYYAMAHMAAVVKPGAVRISSSSTAEKLTQAAFINPDGTRALVVCNEGDSRILNVNDGTHAFTASLPARSVVSFRW